MARVDNLDHFLTDVANAIRTKGGTESTIAASNFDTAIANLPEPTGTISITQNGTGIDVSSYASADVNVSGSNLSDYFNSSTSWIQTWSPYTWATLIKRIPPFEMQGTSMSNSFRDYQGIEIPIITNGISNITNFTQCFQRMTNVVSVDLSSYEFGNNVSLFYELFRYCDKLEEVNMSSLYDTEATNCNFSLWFNQCKKLKKVNLSNFNPYSLSTTSNNTFTTCPAMEEIDMSSFEFSRLLPDGDTSMFGTSASQGIPNNCLILVKNQTEKDWFTTYYSRLTNVQIKSQYIANQSI